MYAHQLLSSDHLYLKELNSLFIPLFFTTPIAIINPDYMYRGSFAVASLLFTESIHVCYHRYNRPLTKRSALLFVGIPMQDWASVRLFPH